MARFMLCVVAALLVSVINGLRLLPGLRRMPINIQEAPPADVQGPAPPTNAIARPSGTSSHQQQQHQVVEPLHFQFTQQQLTEHEQEQMDRQLVQHLGTGNVG